MSQPLDPRRYSSKSKRPASIPELTEQALNNLQWDENEDIKHYLRVAGNYRRDGKEFVRTGELENAFVQLTRAAILVLEKLPLHRDYYTLLSPAQRQNLGLVRVYQLSGLGAFGCIMLLEDYRSHLTGSARQISYDAMPEILGLPHGKSRNFVPCSVTWFGMDGGTGLTSTHDLYGLFNSFNGQDMLDTLGDLKPTLVDRFDKWIQAHPDGIDNERTPDANLPHPMPNDAQTQASAAQYHEEEQRREQRRLAAEEAARWRRQREEQEELTERTRKDAVAAARQAANAPQRSATRDGESDRERERVFERERLRLRALALSMEE
ncbi:uncharacterized protein LACBIDRAFT_299573 [Laccaria bicolor S238N-H82]|uniref:Predicted protein n=1 Tax=Laccaria bicolor (strain S238N-H82 / ATCC MYA-4686) TaxID=486041 RepID=B0DEW3_LACBS|nr:uncharacterized protein LACBIDRAFT_299573 [Laccaria bicolor S238N-H82]EDR06615.1 predicted protein [Laccaria bicolor S238N-H82]|eukprot:XP_001882462.1 predicted protein [Laccaria bicolor S238N-H82]